MFVMITTFLGVLSPELLEHLEVPVLVQDSSPPPAQRLLRSTGEVGELPKTCISFHCPQWAWLTIVFPLSILMVHDSSLSKVVWN